MKSADVYFKVFDQGLETANDGNCRNYKLTFCGFVFKLLV
jgi:hypothetical protein